MLACARGIVVLRGLLSYDVRFHFKVVNCKNMFVCFKREGVEISGLLSCRVSHCDRLRWVPVLLRNSCLFLSPAGK